MDAGIGTSLTAILDEIIGINTVIPVDSTEGVAPELPLRFLALSRRDRGRGERRVPFESDRIAVSVADAPGQIVPPVNLCRIRTGGAIGDCHSVGLCFRTFLGVGVIAATEDPQ